MSAALVKNIHLVAIKELPHVILTFIAKFSTYDNDIDKAHFTCAITSKCGWWYYVCDAINPNECLPMGKQGKTCHG